MDRQTLMLFSAIGAILLLASLIGFILKQRTRGTPNPVIDNLNARIGGIVLASLIGAALWWITPFNPWQSFLIALLINLLGFAGGIVMSAIKRDRGVKDPLTRLTRPTHITIIMFCPVYR